MNDTLKDTFIIKDILKTIVDKVDKKDKKRKYNQTCHEKLFSNIKVKNEDETMFSSSYFKFGCSICNKNVNLKNANKLKKTPYERSSWYKNCELCKYKQNVIWFNFKKQDEIKDWNEYQLISSKLESIN